MKKLKFVVFVYVTLLSLGMTACSSLPKLDLSTLDPANPIQVGGIFMFIGRDEERDLTVQGNKSFFAKYWDGKTRDEDGDVQIDKNQLLTILCETVADDWKFITETFTAKTGLTLNGEQFLQELKDGDPKGIVSEKTGNRKLGSFYYQ
jgi:hypothetical protein